MAEVEAWEGRPPRYLFTILLRARASHPHEYHSTPKGREQSKWFIPKVNSYLSGGLHYSAEGASPISETQERSE